jgi:hypothetical protein
MFKRRSPLQGSHMCRYGRLIAGIASATTVQPFCSHFDSNTGAFSDPRPLTHGNAPYRDPAIEA